MGRCRSLPGRTCLTGKARQTLISDKANLDLAISGT